MNKKKDKEIEFVKEIAKISMTSLCHEIGVNKSNFAKGLTTDEKIEKVAKECEKRVLSALFKYKNG